MLSWKKAFSNLCIFHFVTCSLAQSDLLSSFLCDENLNKRNHPVFSSGLWILCALCSSTLGLNFWYFPQLVGVKDNQELNCILSLYMSLDMRGQLKLDWNQLSRSFPFYSSHYGTQIMWAFWEFFFFFFRCETSGNAQAMGFMVTSSSMITFLILFQLSLKLFPLVSPQHLQINYRRPRLWVGHRWSFFQLMSG